MLLHRQLTLRNMNRVSTCRTLLKPISRQLPNTKPFYLTHQRPLPIRPIPTGIRHHGSHHHHHHDADLMTTLTSSSKRGTRITIIGLASNVGLTIAKGVAGWAMNSASLLAEALHSFSDLLSDFVTLYTFKMSRKPADSIYPYGYGKFETVGSVTVSSLLLAGAVGIGYHSFDLLLVALQSSAPLISDSAATVAATTQTAVEQSQQTPIIPSSLHHHGHHHSGVLNPNAAWFALASVIIKEWLYRASKVIRTIHHVSYQLTILSIAIKVGVAERSEVLMANAWHHRADAYSSGVALAAIVGSYAGMPVLDPIGGLIVSGMLVKSSVGLLATSMQELMDKGIATKDLKSIESAIHQVKKEQLDIVHFHSLRGRKVGPFHHIDFVLQLSPSITVQKAYQLEEMVQSSIKENCKNIQKVSIYLEDPKADVDKHHHHHH
ncbi:cation efflux family-domain-containing protein [Choanephora cucurbitarum]|nr:cation efflux family-domain-containing protein [Choanephora cucurbitarum]